MAIGAALMGQLRQAWSSGKHVGNNRPVTRAYIRTVKLQRRFRVVDADRVYADIPGLDRKSRTIWMGKWVPKTEWKPLPNVYSYELQQDFDSNGIAQTTITIDNLAMVEKTGPLGGIYHAIVRGFFSPWRGFNSSRPKIGTKNEWFDVLSDKSSQIIILSGYGTAVVPVFEGLVNDFDISTKPDRITLTCRDGGQVVSDQNVFINAKARNVRDPITFCDRNQADKIEQVGHAPEASDHNGAHPARFVLDDSTKTEWKSDDRDNASPANLPWVQIAVPAGRYDTITLHPRYDAMTCYLAIENNGHWIDAGKGNAPGTAVPYVAKMDRTKARPNQNFFGLPDDGYRLDDGARFRVYFDNLDYGPAEDGDTRAYRAGVIEFHGSRRTLDPNAVKEKWILVDDLADVVRTIFQWCGLNDWEVETTGVRLKDKAVWNRGNTLVDIINAACEAVGYVCYYKPREHFSESEEHLANMDDEDSMGIAVFRQNQAMHKGAGVRDPIEYVHEDTILTGVNAHFTDEPLASIIRVRGKEKRKKDGGRTLGGDRIERAMYVYIPPWARFGNQYRNANIKKYVVHHDEQLRNGEECELAALFIAFREALEAAQVQFDAPCMPTIFLDHQTAIYDEGSALSTRVWIALRQISYQGGKNAHFTMNLGGAALDLPDVTAVRQELTRALRDRGYDPGLSQWELDHFGDTYRND